MRAARYLGVAPWELLDRPAAWLHWALTAESAEAEAQDQRMKDAQRSGG